jgi:predicted transposase/invertase (TIGR01784 family)
MDQTTYEKMSPEEKWKNATIANNFIFYKVMHNNPDVCKELLEILLEIKIDHIDIKQEDEVQIDYGKKGIRMDVYAVGASKAYNLEMQATDTKELPERSRYYLGCCDVDSLLAGGKYKDLKDTYIIFICIPDIFNEGLCKYKFENLCVDNPKIKLNDRAFKYFFIAENYDKIQDERQKAFLKLVLDNKPTNPFGDKLSKLVDDAKRNTQWRKQFMDWEIEKAYSFDAGKEEGKLEGIQEKAIEDAKQLLKEGDSPEKISRCIGLPLEQVLELQKSSKTK